MVGFAQAKKTVQEFVMPDGNTMTFESTEGVTVTKEEAIRVYEAQKIFDELKEREHQHPSQGNSQTAADTPQPRPRVSYLTKSERAELARLAAGEKARNRALAALYGKSTPTTTVSPPPPPPIDAITGVPYIPAAGGVIHPLTGTFHLDVAGGYINTRTGQFSPK